MDTFKEENHFLLNCPVSRFEKLLTLEWALGYVAHTPGAIVECGVFKGASLATLAAINTVKGYRRPIVAFDMFGAKFPAQTEPRDVAARKAFTEEAGEWVIDATRLEQVLREKGTLDIELVSGNIVETAQAWSATHPEKKIALLNLDVDVYDASKAALEALWPHVTPGGMVLLDDYGVFAGETRAADEFLGGRIQKSPYRTKQAFARKY